MNLLARIRSVFARSLSSPLDPRRGQTWILPQGYVPDGLRLTQQQTLEVSTVWACTHLIASSIAASPWNVFEVAQGKRSKVENDTLGYLLNVRPNPEVTAQGFKEGMLFQALIHGNAYAEIERDGAQRPVGLWPLLSDQMLPPTRDANGTLVYTYVNFDGSHVTLPAERVLHFRGPALDALMGVSTTVLAMKSIAHAAAAERFSLGYFANSATPSGILQSAKPLKPAEAEQLRVEFAAKYGGAKKAGMPMVLGAGVEWKGVSNDPQKSQMVEAQSFSVQTIARFYGVPLHFLADPQGSQGYGANQETLGLAFTRYTLTPWCRRLEQEANHKLIAWRVPRLTAIDLTHLTHGTAKERAEADEVRIRSGVMTPNEAREAAGLNHGGEELDNHFVQNSLVPVDRLTGEAKLPEIFQYHLTAGIPTVNEVRQRLGLPPIPGGDVPTSTVQPAPANTRSPEEPEEDDTEVEDPEDPEGAEMPETMMKAALALEGHARRWKARERDLREHNKNGTLEAKLEAARKELRAKLPADLVPLAEAIESGVPVEKVVLHHFGARA